MCAMDDIKILPNVSIPSVKLQSVRMPIVGNRITLPSGGGGILNDLKSHMIGWYDVKRQGCTNESLTANPVLEDLSGNNHPLELKNFVFGGLSGMGTEMYPNSLVFNGVTPKYVINRDNVTLNNNTIALGINKFKLTGNGRITKHIRGNAGQPLDVTIPSFMVRATGIKKVDGIDKHIQVNILDNVNSETKYHLVIRNDGTYIISGITYTIEPTDETFVPIAQVDIRAYQFSADNEYELEFLPNYPAPTTNMYGIIPTITHGVKCMMMDFVPTFPMVYTGLVVYYTQRPMQSGDNYTLMIEQKILTSVIAYNRYNSNGTYINGQYNNTLKHVDLLNKRQVVSVNANEVYELPANRGIVIGTGENIAYRFSTMALNSLILFDRELTEEEMKLVMDKLMMYEDVDNIAAINQDIGLPIIGTADPNMDLD